MLRRNNGYSSFTNYTFVVVHISVLGGNIIESCEGQSPSNSSVSCAVVVSNSEKGKR